MPNFAHSFFPASANPVGSNVDLTVREIEDAALKEILQTPGVATGPWGLFDPLLDPGNPNFVFREPLGQAREVKTALSGLFGRFVARAYATRHLSLSAYAHIARPPMRLNGVMKGVVDKVAGTSGDLPDWVAWGANKGLAIVEAKGCHSRSGTAAILGRAYAQAGRAEILRKGKVAPFKRFAIATRWGFAAPISWDPMIAVHDPDEEGEGLSREEVEELAIGVVRLHCARLLKPLGHPELADALTQMVQAPFPATYQRALEVAQKALASTSPCRVDFESALEPADELVGGYVVRGAILGDARMSVSDQQTLERLGLHPTFVGIEHRALKLAIEGNIEEIGKAQVVAALGPGPGAGGPRNDGSGAWVVRLGEDQAQIRPG